VLIINRREAFIARVPEIAYLNEPDIANELDDNEWRAFLSAFDDREGFVARFADARLRGSVPRELAEVYYQSFRASKPLFCLELATGLRRGDLISTEWQNIVILNDAEHGRTTYLKRVNRKTGKAVFIPLTPEAVAGIEECRKRAIRSTRWVFVQENGNRFSLTTLRRHFAVAKELAGITRRLRFHDLRHSVGSRLVSRGVEITTVRDVLGHSSVVTTQRYSRPSLKARKAITSALSVEPIESVYTLSTESSS